MRNQIQRGENLTVPAPYNVKSGEGALIGSIFGVAAEDAVTGSEVDIVTMGVFYLPKVEAEALAIGDPVYWDDAARHVTGTVDPDVTRIGVVTEPAGNPSGTAAVRLNGSF